MVGPSPLQELFIIFLKYFYFFIMVGPSPLQEFFYNFLIYCHVFIMVGPLPLQEFLIISTFSLASFSMSTPLLVNRETSMLIYTNVYTYTIY